MLKRYLPTKWVGGKTIGTADVMNNIEDGILNAHQKVDELDSQIKEIANNGVVSNSSKIFKIESIGELIPRKSAYTAWPRQNLVYDKDLDKYVCIINGATAHGTSTTENHYICFIDPDTYECSEPTSIVITLEDNTTENLQTKAICNFVIDSNGYYNFLILRNGYQHKIQSTDKGTTWTDLAKTNQGSGVHFWGIRVLSNGRWIAGMDVGNKGIFYSDDEGINWTQVVPANGSGNYNDETCILELDTNGSLMAIARKNTGGAGVAYDGESDHALISFSTDYGTTWTDWVESSSIDNMNASSCDGYVHDGIVEIFACSRWYHNGTYTNNDFTNTGKNGAIIHYTATIENALLDNFTKNGVVVYANTVDGQNSAQDFHAPCIAVNGDDMLLVYFDRVFPYTSEITNYFFIRGSLNGLRYKANDIIVSDVFSYSSKYEKALFDVMLEKINTLQYALSQIEGSGVSTPTGTLLWTFEWDSTNNSEKLVQTTNSPLVGNMYATANNSSGEVLFTQGGNSVFKNYKLAIPYSKANFAFYANMSYVSSSRGCIGIYDTDGFHGIHCPGSANWVNADGSFSVPKTALYKTYHTIKIVKNGGEYKLYVDDNEYTCGVISESSGYMSSLLMSGTSQFYEVTNSNTTTTGSEIETPVVTAPYFFATGEMWVKEFKFGEWDS